MAAKLPVSAREGACDFATLSDFIWGWSDFKWVQRLVMVVTTWVGGGDGEMVMWLLKNDVIVEINVDGDDSAAIVVGFHMGVVRFQMDAATCYGGDNVGGRLWSDFIWGWSDFKWMQRLAMVVTTWVVGGDGEMVMVGDGGGFQTWSGQRWGWFWVAVVVVGW
ncbi:hypothetical protein Tco_0986653 [Tanacetum coccineum]